MANISITAASVLRSSSGQPVIKTVGPVAIARGEGAYLLANGTAGLADSNGTSPANTFFGIALSDASPGQQIAICTGDAGGFILGGTMTIGPVYVSNTPGKFTQALGDLAAGSKILQIGVALTTTTLNLAPLTGGTTT